MSPAMNVNFGGTGRRVGRRSAHRTPGIGRGDAPALDEFRAVLVKELGHRARGAAGDLLESVSRVLVLAGEDRPLARDEQLSRPRRYPGVDEALEELALGRDPEGDVLAELRRKQLERLRPRPGDGPVRSWCAPQSAGSVSTRNPASAASRWSIRAMRPLPERPVQVREARTSRAAASSDAEKIAGRIVEYGTPVEDANWSML